MAKKIINLMNLERDELDNFCDGLPEPIVAQPVVKTVRGRGLELFLKYPGALVRLVEDGVPCVFPSFDMVAFELDGVPNVDISSLMPKTAYYQHLN
ncbi:MAG: hypothetical protein ACXWTY_11950 [Methylobacter sp.]